MTQRSLKAIAGIFSSVVFSVIFFVYLKDVLKGIPAESLKINYTYALLFGIFLFLNSNIVRVFRWIFILDRISENNIDRKKAFVIYFSSLLLNNCLPLRAGDIWRTLTLYRGRSQCAVKTGVVSVIIERVSDLLFLAFIFSFFNYGTWAVSGILLLGLLWYFNKSLLSVFPWIAGKLGQLSNMIGNVGPDFYFYNVLFTSLVWVLDLSCYYFLFKAISPDVVGFFDSLLIGVVATFSTLIPAAPGYVGTFHVAITAAAVLLGYPEGLSGVGAVLIHSVIWICSMIPGILIFISRPSTFVLSYKILKVTK